MNEIKQEGGRILETPEVSCVCRCFKNIFISISHTDAPRWSSLPTTVRGCAEDKVILQCGFNGSPPPELKWLIKTNLNISSSSAPPSLLSSTNLPEMTSETQVTEAVEGFQSNEMKGLEDYRPLPIDGNYETKMNGKIFEVISKCLNFPNDQQFMTGSKNLF